MARPNILFFMPDQLRADCVGCFGNGLIQTPNIDALAARGTRFTNAFVNHPVCSPSRVNLMTGWYPHTRGHRTLTHLVQRWEPNLLKYLKAGGYNVAWAGQRGDMFAPGVTEDSTHFSGWIVKPETRSMGPQHPPGSPLYDAFYHGRRPGGTWLDFDEAAVRTAEAWLAGKPQGPWMLFLPLIFPHLPFEVEDPWYSMHSPLDMPARLAPAEAKPAFHAAIREKYGLARLSPEDWAEICRVYYGMVSRIDHQLGRVVEAIDRAGELGDTAVFFFTDHGEYLGDFGLVEKWPSGLDACLTRNPLIVSMPGGREGQVSDSLVEMVDLLPTVLELADLDAAHTHFGKSLCGACADGEAVVKRAAFTEGGFSLHDARHLERPAGEYRKKGELQHERPHSVGRAIAMRDASYTYVYRLYEDDELYDRREDPAETTNLIDRAELRDVADTMRGELLHWLVETSDVIPWAADPRFPRVPDGYHSTFEPTGSQSN